MRRIPIRMSNAEGRTRTTLPTSPLAVLVGFTILFIVGPLAYVLFTPFTDQEDSVSRALSIARAPETRQMLLNTLQYTALGTAIATLFGTALAWSTEVLQMGRTGRLIPLGPLLLPPLLGALGWMLMFSPSAGYGNHILERALGLSIDIYGLVGMAFVGGIYATPYTYLAMSAAFANANLELQEASAMSGAGTIRRAKDILAGSAPSLLIGATLSAITLLGDLGVPLVLGLSANRPVLTTQIYAYVSEYPQDLFAAQVLGGGAVLLGVAALVLYSRVASRTGRYASIGGKGARRGLQSHYRVLARAIVATYILVALLTPILGLTMTSLSSYWSGRIQDVAFDLSAYNALLADQGIREALRNSMVVAIAGATIGSIWMSCVAFFIVRRSGRAATTLRAITTLPMVVPSVIVALAVLSVAVRSPLYGSLWILVFGYLIAFFAQGVRLIEPGVAAISPELEEAAAMSGAKSSRAILSIVFPLALPSVAGVWIFLSIMMFQESSVSLLLYTPETTVVGPELVNLWADGAYPLVAAFGTTIVFAAGLGMIVQSFVVGRGLARRRTAVDRAATPAGERTRGEGVAAG